MKDKLNYFCNTSKNPASQPKSITLSSGKWGWILFIAIIAIRAFQPSAQPIETWSLLSWFFMSLPVTWPFVVYLVAKALWCVLAPICWLLERR